jgi:topoisomerase IV subunit A
LRWRPNTTRRRSKRRWWCANRSPSSFRRKAETTSKILAFASNGRFYTIEASKLPGGRGHGEPVRLFADIEQDGELVSVFRLQGGRKFLVASDSGRGFVVAEDDCVANTRKGKQVLNVTPPDKAVAIAPVDGEMAAAIGDNRKLVIFPLDQVPEMARGRGVRLQRHKDGGLSDVATFKGADGLTWIDSAGRSFVQSLKELAAWRGNRGDAGRVRPDRFLTNNKFGARNFRDRACGRRPRRGPRFAVSTRD